MSKDNNELSRDAVIIRTSILGIIANIFLAGFKAAVGIFSNSIAVVLDAVNNLSDALSSVVTIIGTKLAGKKPDKKHPLGYGRIEYISAMVVAAIVLYAGITAMVESIKKIISPEAPEYSATALIIIGAAVIVKILLGSYVKATGKRVNSGALIASGSDALFDAVLSLSVFVSAVIFLLTGISLEAYVGVVIAGFIIKAGIEMLIDTVDELLGKRADRELVKEIKRAICEDGEISGAFDLFMHSYGPDKYIASVHVEIKDTMTATEIDAMERRLANRIYEKYGVILAGIGIYTINTGSDEAARLRAEITRQVMSHDGVIQMHGFYADMEKKSVSFDVILDFEVDDRAALFNKIKDEVIAAHPDYSIEMAMDIDV